MYRISSPRSLIAGVASLWLPMPALFPQQPAVRLVASERLVPDSATPRSPVFAPFKAGNRFFDMDQAGTLRVRDGEHGVARPLLPSRNTAIVAPSHEGRYIAYADGQPRAPYYDVRVRDVQTGRDLPDVLHHARISAAPWSHDQKGFLYIRQDTTDGRERVYYHGLGRSAANDALILSQFDHPEWRYAARVSDDGHYAVFTISYPADDHTRIYFIDLDDPDKPNFGAPVVKLAQTFNARYEFVDNAGSYFFLQTDLDAPRGRILLANTDLIRESRWPSVIPESSDTLLFARTAGEEFLVAVYRSATGGTVARLFGPEDPAVLRTEMRNRLDSLNKARARDGEQRSNRSMSPRGLMGNGPLIRLQPRQNLPVPAGASIAAMNSVADDEQLFYTVRLSNGTLQSYQFDVKNGRSEPYPATVIP